MNKGIRFVILFLVVSGFLFLSPFIASQETYACDNNDDCGGATCKPDGTCTGGGTECGWGVGASCPAGYSCNDGNCEQSGTIPGTGTGPGCFPAGTEVTLENNTTKNIEDIKTGDRVLSQDSTGKQSISNVQRLIKPISGNICEIKYTNGDKLTVTKGHPLFTQNGWKAIDPVEAAKEDSGVPVSRLTTGDFMTKADGTWPQISSISCKDEIIQTYNLVVDNAHTYFAGGFLAHNKGVCQGCSGGGSPVTVGPVTSVTIRNNRTTPPSATIIWTGGGGGCAGGGNGVKIFIGTDLDIVQHDCRKHTYGATLGYAAPYDNETCFPAIEVGPGSGNFNTAGRINFDPNKIYYIRVNSWFSFCDRNDECSGDFCGGVNQPFLASCPLVPNPASMDEGETKVFSTFSEDPAIVQSQWITPNTLTYPPEVDAVARYGHNTTAGALDPECTNMCGMIIFVHDGILVAGHNWGRGDVTFRIAMAGGAKYITTGVEWGGGWRIDKAYLSWARLAAAGVPDAIARTRTIDHITVQSVSQPVPDFLKIWGTTYGAPPTENYISVIPPAEDRTPPTYRASVLANLPTTSVPALLGSSVFAKSFAPPNYAACTGLSRITIAEGNREAWWQLKDSDVVTSGSLKSLIPTGKFFGEKGLGGFPGVPAYAGSKPGITTANVSETQWLVKSLTINPPVFNYEEIESRTPENVKANIKPITSQGDLVGATATYGYEWYKYDGAGGDLVFNNSLALGTRKVVLLVNSNFVLGNTINLTKGRGFFMVVVNGDIRVRPGVDGGANPDLEGLYVADQFFIDQTAITNPVEPETEDSQLWVRGSVAAYGGVRLNRNLVTGNAEPAELFEYAPDQIMLFPSILGDRNIKWAEVAP